MNIFSMQLLLELISQQHLQSNFGVETDSELKTSAVCQWDCGTGRIRNEPSRPERPENPAA